MHFRTWLSTVLATLSFAAHTLCTIDAATILPNSCEDLQPRLEIREFAQNTDQFTVFLLGLKRMQEANSSDPMSYYDLASAYLTLRSEIRV
jgi:hypothetical protein